MQKKTVKVLCVFGTRPEATKMVPLIKALQDCDAIETTVCVTAQHRALLDGVLNPFHIQPDYDLDLMKPGQSLSDLLCRALKGLESVLAAAEPDLLLVHGDTLTTVAASLAAFYAQRQVRLGHVEAGLRTYDKYRPYPEEINRKLTAALTDLHFAPTPVTRDQLLKENIPPSAVYVTGNTAIDFMRYTVAEPYIFQNDILNKLDFSKRIIVMTAHRRESWGKPLENIDRAAARIATDFQDVTIVYAMHPNPQVTEPARRILGGSPGVMLTDALDVRDLHNLMRRSYMVMADSGGLQEEAAALHKPMVLMREVTERPEGLQAGTMTLAGVGEDSVYAAVAELLTDTERYRRMSEAVNPFGDGRAAERIVQAILYTYGLRSQRPEEFGRSGV